MKIFVEAENRVNLENILKHPFLNELEKLEESKENPLILMKKQDIFCETENMPLKVPFSKINISWFYNDSKENQGYLKKYVNKQIKTFTDYEITKKFFDETENYWFMISSGSLGEKLMEMIHDKPSLIGVVIFCQNLEKYKILAVNYKKIIKVVNSGFKEVLDKIEGFFKYFLGKHIFCSIDYNLNLSRMPRIRENEEEIIVVSHEIGTKFSTIIDLILKRKILSKNVDFMKIHNELSNLAESENEKKIIDETYFLKKNLFQAILYIYSINIVQKKLNFCLISDNYDNILQTLAFLFMAIFDKNLVDEKFVKTEGILYKVIKKNKSSEYRNNHTMFWKTFIHTTESLSEEVKEGTSDCTVFEIRLSKIFPHPHMKLLKLWTISPKNGEVLLWPNFAFHTISIRKEKRTYFVILQQDENYCILLEDLIKLRNWWDVYVSDKVRLHFCDFFKRLKFKIKEVTDFFRYFKANSQFIIKLSEKSKNKQELFDNIKENFMRDNF